MLSHMQHNSNQNIPPVRDLVLVGGGHSHVQVLKSFGMRPQPGVRLTLISRELETPYSGMLPGCVSGAYSEDDIHIKLGPLCQFAGARLIHGEVAGLDLANQTVRLRDRPDLRYDVLSLNSGAVPVPPSADAITVKPISQFLPKWKEVQASILADQTLVIVGGGAGGVELAMAARSVLSKGIRIVVVGAQLLPGHSPSAIKRVMRQLARLDIEWMQARALHQTGNELMLEGEDAVVADYVLWVTDVAAPAWIKEAGLATDERGFLLVDERLRSTSNEQIFAAGDVAHLTGQQRAKSGVYAVRAGPFLARNLRHAILGKPLQKFRAQRQHLALIGDGHGGAVASRSGWSAQGRFWWWLKDRIDRNFINKFNDLPVMPEETVDLPENLRSDLPEQLMRCGGCGAKLAADPLRRVLRRLPDQASASVVLGIGDDAAQITNSRESTLLTIDGFRAMVDDPYLFGRIAAHHSLNDIFAMLARPTSALAFATVPLMAEALMEEELFQLLSGVVDVLNEQDVPLVGGHSAEGAELSIGLTITGEPGERTLQKGGAEFGDHLIMTKAIGSGVVLAAAMRGLASPASVKAAQASMDQSNASATAVFAQSQANALTDITGFGLAGHLGEMLRASQCGVILELQKIPLFPNVVELLGQLQSSLQQANEIALQDYQLQGPLIFSDPNVRALADPQTSGGLLAAVPAGHVEACLKKLVELGFAAADIGRLTEPGAWIIKDSS
jgi:selenide,water dikinase